MKQFYVLAATLLLSLAGMAQFEFGASYSLGIPQQEMAKNIQPLHSINAKFAYILPGHLKRVSLGIETGFGIYAFETKEQDLRFPDGSGIKTRVNYSSNAVTANLQARVSLYEKAKINPYINGKTGLASFFSNVTVEDPEDASSCEPLDRKNIISDNTMYFAYGAGVAIDLAVFCKKQRPGIASLDIALNRVSGGKLDYINTKHIKDYMVTDPTAPQPAPGKPEPLNIQFVNVSTQAIHTHQVAEVYNSPLRMFEIRVGIICRLEK